MVDIICGLMMFHDMVMHLGG